MKGRREGRPSVRHLHQTTRTERQGADLAQIPLEDQMRTHLATVSQPDVSADSRCLLQRVHPAENPRETVLPSAATTAETGTADDNRVLLLGGAGTSSFRRKRKLHNMHDISACLCGRLARPNEPNVACCRIAGCETKWVSDLICMQWELG